MSTQTLSLDTAFEEFIASFAEVFSKPQLARFRVYLPGLIVYIGTHWLSRMHESVGHTKDYTTFTRFVSEAPWSYHEAEVEWRGYGFGYAHYKFEPPRPSCPVRSAATS